MASTVTIDGTVTALNLYQDTFKDQIVDQLKNPLQFENLMTRVRVPGGVYTPPRAEMGDTLQPYQSGYTPNSSITFFDKRIIAQKIKVDIKVTEDQIMAFHQKWMTAWSGNGKDPVEWSFPRFLWEKLISLQIPHEMDHNSFNGVYAAPTPGTPGASIASVDGLKTVLAAAITANDVTPVTTGALTPTTVMDKVRTFCGNLPSTVKYLPGRILMSETNARYYRENYRDTYGFAAGNSDLEDRGTTVDDFGKRIVGVRAMEGSNRFILQPDVKPNLVCVEDSNFASFPEIYWVVGTPREIQGAATITRAYAWEDDSELYVSDNA